MSDALACGRITGAIEMIAAKYGTRRLRSDSARRRPETRGEAASLPRGAEEEEECAWMPDVGRDRAAGLIIRAKKLIIEDREWPGGWRVEWVDDDGGIEVAIFSGPQCAGAGAPPRRSAVFRSLVR